MQAEMVRWCAGVAAALLLGAGQVRADEKIALDKLPDSVVTAVMKRFPDAKMTGAEKEVEKGKTTYEVAIKDGEKKIDVMVSSEGKIETIEKEIALKDVPEVVKTAIMNAHPQGTIKSAEEVIKVDGEKEKLDYYELVVVVDKKNHEVQVTPKGKIKKVEAKEEDEKKEEAKEKKE